MEDQGAVGMATGAPGADALTGILKTLKELKDGQHALQRTLESKIDQASQKIEKDFKKKLDDMADSLRLDFTQLSDTVTGLDTKVADINTELSGRLKVVEDRVDDMLRNQPSAVSRDGPFEPDYTVIITQLPVQPSEDDLLTCTNQLIQVSLELPGIEVVKVERTQSRGGKPGVVKVLLSSVQDKVDILKSKRKLKESEAHKRVYIHGSRTPAERILYNNMRAMLRELPNGQQYRISGNGKLVRKDAGSTATEDRDLDAGSTHSDNNGQRRDSH